MFKNFVVNLKNMITSEQGAVLVLVALGMVVLLGCASFVTDIGLLYTSRNHLINTADAAALAGAQELPDQPELAEAVARDYSRANGVAEECLDVKISTDNRSITVRPRRDVQFLFARVLGFTEQEVNAEATALTAPLTGAVGIVPFSIEEQELEMGERYFLKEGAGGPAKAGPDGRRCGWYGALDPDNHPGGGANDYRERIKHGYQMKLQVGDRILIESGNMSGPTTQGVEYRIKQCKNGCTHDNFDLDCPRVMIIPVIKPVNSKEVEIRGFAAFFLEGVQGQGKDNYVIGRFVRMVSSGELGGGTDYGAYAVKLIQ